MSALLVGVSYGQRYKDFKAQLQTEAAKYRTSEPCEAETKKAIENLDNLIWSDQPPADKKEEIRRSSAFVRTKGCPQTSLLILLKEISDFYKESGVETSPTNPTAAQEEETHVTNLSDTLSSPEEENANPTNYKPTVYAKAGRDYFLYFLTGILSLICLWLIFKIRNSQPIVSASTMTNEKLDKISDSQLADIIRQLRDDLGLLRHRLAELESEVQLLKAQSQNAPAKTERQPENRQLEEVGHTEGFVVKQKTVSEPEMLTQDSAPEMRFALYMDNSDGFSVSGLMYHEGAETIYEIALQSPKTAVYRIAQNRDAQNYALSDPGYYLRTACDYENPPANGKKIETVNEGALELVGSIWKITKRAKVRFV